MSDDPHRDYWLGAASGILGDGVAGAMGREVHRIRNPPPPPPPPPPVKPPNLGDGLVADPPRRLTPPKPMSRWEKVGIGVALVLALAGGLAGYWLVPAHLGWPAWLGAVGGTLAGASLLPLSFAVLAGVLEFLEELFDALVRFVVGVLGLALIAGLVYLAIRLAG